jgi:surfeit locus 1 family protein
MRPVACVCNGCNGKCFNYPMMHYRFKPKLGMSIATLAVMALCIQLGFWQYNKAQSKINAQQQIDLGMQLAPAKLPSTIDDEENWRYKRVSFKGEYMPEYQIILDNRVYNTKAGYQVITPIKVKGDQERYVLVNRGWIEGNPNRTLPTIETPVGEHIFIGDLFFPQASVFTLESAQEQNAAWQPLWQHANMQRYQSLVPFKVKPYIVRLASGEIAGGFVRDWPVPKSRITVHLGYAYQWFGFAITIFFIYIVLNLKKLKKEK